jgi:hypothetical protein
MCKAITKSGKRCKIKGEDYFCHIHSYVEPSIEEQRASMLQKLLKNPLQSQVEAMPLFEGIDLTVETLELIKRVKYVVNLTDEAYDMLISTYFDDGVKEIDKYELINQTIKFVSVPEDNNLKKIQTTDLARDFLLLYIKATLSQGKFWQGLELARRIYNYTIIPHREEYVELYREEQTNKLRVKEAKKYTRICDDVCEYIILKYL